MKKYKSEAKNCQKFDSDCFEMKNKTKPSCGGTLFSTRNLFVNKNCKQKRPKLAKDIHAAFMEDLDDFDITKPPPSKKSRPSVSPNPKNTKLLVSCKWSGSQLLSTLQSQSIDFSIEK